MTTTRTDEGREISIRIEDSESESPGEEEADEGTDRPAGVNHPDGPSAS
jgi:hypothetical protein